ncbi:response regulator containing a CheY-like receiver domain and an HTH DNA-binding domain [Mycobacteroides abscessus subsp. abscessus]|nr:response regulator containing a CheY-like receiver domain and an HTH DNA-binding domain [Mycobacteroides abscessus subsp. abscessus]
MSRRQLAEAVRDAANGKTVLAPSVANRLVDFVRQPTRPALSARETEVLKLVALGKTNAQSTAAVTSAMALGLLG